MTKAPEQGERRDVRILLGGDLVLDEPNAAFFFDGVRDTLKGADAAVAHVEVPHTRRGVEVKSDVPAPGAAPENLAAMAEAGISVATLAGNHIFDRGPEGVEDTVAELRRLGVGACGAGVDLEAAKAPAVLDRGGRRIAVLAYNCVGPEMAWAGEGKAGCAYVRVLTEDGRTAGPQDVTPATTTHADPISVEAMQADIRSLREQTDLLIVALHKGMVHTPAALAPFERPVSHAAIDAGADVVVGHHAHILRGVETHAGKPIFHGLGNLVTVTRALSADSDSPERRAWAAKRKVLFGFEPDPDYPLYPFHPEAKNAMLADVRLGADGTLSAGFLPCWMQPTGQPEVLGRVKKGEAVVDYVRRITRHAGLNAAFEWEGDRVVMQ